MGCSNSKKKNEKLLKKKKGDGQSCDKPSASPAPVTSPTDSMRADHHYPESLQSYEPSSSAAEQIRQEGERLRRELDMRLTIRVNFNEPVNNKVTAESSGSCERKQEQSASGRSSSGASSRGKTQTKCEQASDPPMGATANKPAHSEKSQNAPDQSNSKSVQSRPETSDGEKPIEVNATLHRFKEPLPKRQNEMANQAQPSRQGANPSKDPDNVPRLLSFEKPRSLPFPGAVSRKASVTRPPFGSQTSFPQATKPPSVPGGTQANTPGRIVIPKPQSFGSNTGGVSPQSSITQAQPFPSTAAGKQRSLTFGVPPNQPARPAFGGPGLPAPGKQNQLPPPKQAPFGTKPN